MKILMLVPQAFYSPRGTPLSAYHRTRDLKALGHEVDILTYAVGDPPPDPDLKVFRSIGPHFARRIKQGPSYIKIWFDFLLLLNLIGRLARTPMPRRGSTRTRRTAAKTASAACLRATESSS